MSKIIKTINLLGVFSGLLLFGSVTTNTWAATLSFVPDPQNVNLGDPFEVGIQISGLGDGTAPSLGTYDFDIGFDSNILNFDSVVFGDPTLGDQLDLDGFGSQNAATLNPGGVNIFGFSFDSITSLNNLQADEFILAVLRFDTLAVGLSPLNLTNIILGPADPDNEPPISFDVEPGLVTVVDSPVAIPEPGTVFLMMLGLLGVSFGVWRKSA